MHITNVYIQHLFKIPRMSALSITNVEGEIFSVYYEDFTLSLNERGSEREYRFIKCLLRKHIVFVRYHTIFASLIITSSITHIAAYYSLDWLAM